MVEAVADLLRFCGNSAVQFGCNSSEGKKAARRINLKK